MYIYTILRSSTDRLHTSSSIMFVQEHDPRYRSTRMSPSKTTAYLLQPSPRQDHGYLVVHSVGNFLFSMSRTHQHIVPAASCARAPTMVIAGNSGVRAFYP
jgi:hypothetical protein